jgi:hypothetical protein
MRKLVDVGRFDLQTIPVTIKESNKPKALMLNHKANSQIYGTRYSILK